MGVPAFMVLNYANVRQNTGHLLEANENDSDAGKVANGRRSNLNFWVPSTANQEAWLRVDAGVGNTLAPTGFALDRGHNLGGVAPIFESSDSPASGYSSLATPTIPTTPGVDGDLDAANGITTDEGAWIKRITAPTARRYLRFRVPAMGADVRPIVVGLWFGIYWEPGQLWNPLTDEDLELVTDRIETGKAWAGSTTKVRRRLGELVVKLSEGSDEDAANLHIRDQFLAGRLMWIVHNDDKTERSVLAEFPGGRSGFRYAAGWGNRQSVIPWLEYEPKILEAS